MHMKVKIKMNYYILTMVQYNRKNWNSTWKGSITTILIILHLFI